MPYSNRAYIPRFPNAVTASVVAVWEVEADETYHGLHEAGLSSNGLFVSVQGSGVVRLGNYKTQQLHAIESPQFMFVPQGVPCSYWSSSSVNWKFFFLEFGLSGYLADLGLSFSLSYDLASATCALQTCRRIVRELSMPDRGSDVAVAGEFTRLLVSLARAQDRSEPGRPLSRDISVSGSYDRSIHRLIGWMEEHVEERYSVADFAIVAGLSSRQLYRRFLAVTAISPKQYFLILKLQAASRRLQNAHESVTTVAERYGFSDVYHFSRSFSRYMGCSPTVFRRILITQDPPNGAYSTPCIARNRVGVTPSERRKTAPK